MSTPRPVRIQLSRKRGWRKPENTVVVSRPSKWGNPFVVRADWHFMHEVGSPERAVESFRENILKSPSYLASVREELRGKNLACWCALDQPWCHADVLLEIANS